MESLSKKQFGLSFIVILVIVSVSLFVVIKNSSSDDTEDKQVTYENLYETNRVENVKDCKNDVKNFLNKADFGAKLGKDLIGTLERAKESKIKSSSLWLTGSKSKDIKSLYQARAMACEKKIPVIVMRLRPSTGLILSAKMTNWNYYKPDSGIKTWAEYDVKLDYYVQVLKDVPSIVVVEPDLLMFLTDDSEPNLVMQNDMYKSSFLFRVMKIINGLPKSWVYLDVGNAIFLQDHITKLDAISATLTQLQGLRGFVINTYHFLSSAISEQWARRIYCRCGLHYLIDTGRNGGVYSASNFNEMQGCLFDPPLMKQGSEPSWAWGSTKSLKMNKRSVDYDGGVASETTQGNIMMSLNEAHMHVRMNKNTLNQCVSKSSKKTAHDANVWIKNPGESDGRMYKYGEFHECLINHDVNCKGSCQLYGSKDKRYKPTECDCKKSQAKDYYDAYYN